jgi:RNA polymerase sigma factor (sigma-70 family)
MPEGSLPALVQYLRKVVAPRGSGLTDSQLLERFIATRDESAFELLVWRHGAMVMQTCRRLLDHHQDAEDAFQATFLALARKAGSVCRREAVGGWLYRVAYRTALRARATERRRPLPLEVDWPAPAAADAEWQSLRAVLDAEVNRLPAKYRTAFVLCCLEGQTNEQAARQLGCPKGTILSRLSRARMLLRSRLMRRGVTLSAGGLLLLLAREASAAAPRHLVPATVHTAKLFAIGTAAACALSPRIVALTEGVLQAMWMTKVAKIALAAMLLTTLFAGGTGALLQTAFADKPAASKSPDSQEAAKGKPADNKEQPAKGKKEQGPTVHGIIAAIDVNQGTTTVAVMTKGQSKQSEQKTFTVTKDVKVVLEEAFDKKQQQPDGKIGDITLGTQVTLELTADQKTVIRIAARGPGINGHIKAVNAGTRTLTVGTKSKDGPHDTTVTLAEGAKILLSDGLSKEEPPVEGKLADLAEGTPVQVQLSVDRQRALGVQVHGVTLTGYLKSYDTVNNTLIVTVKEEGGAVDKTLTAVKNAQLVDLAPGTPVLVRLSVFDKDKVAAAHGVK